MSSITDKSCCFSDMTLDLKNELAGSLIGSHVLWIQHPAGKIKQIMITVLVVLEVVALTLSLVGIYVLVDAAEKLETLNRYQKLSKVKKAVSPPPFQDVKIKNTLQTFNHHSYFVIHNEVIWCRVKNNHSSWKPIYFDGFIKDQKPVQIQCDGANLVVVDGEDNIHYKKVLEERREKLKGYQCKDIGIKDNWEDRWFTLPLVHKIYHIFGEKTLKIPKNCRGWALSHRGEYSYYFEDLSHKKHKTSAMVTSIYALTEEGSLVYADPYLPNKFGNTLDGPHPDFKGEMISASASTTFLFGTLNDEPKLYTRLADFDTLGKNPLLVGFWNKSRCSDIDWQEHPIPKNISKIESISISQTGKGNGARLLQILTPEDLFEKNILDANWKKTKDTG